MNKLFIIAHCFLTVGGYILKKFSDIMIKKRRKVMKTENDEKITVCKVIKYEKDIKPFPLVKIYSGVGSGKSYFAAKMITGSKEYQIPAHHVLIVTSRRAKVEETLKELGAEVKPTITVNGNLSFDVWQTGEDQPDEFAKYMRTCRFKNDLGEHEIVFYNKSAVCTNAFLSAYLRNVYDPDNPMTHIWNKFDAIIIDEVHSLVTDSTYQSSGFDMLAFIEEYLQRYQNNQLQDGACRHLILMTGTPLPFETHVTIDFPKELTNLKVLFDTCENVVPKNIILIDGISSNINKLLLNNGLITDFVFRRLVPSLFRPSSLDGRVNVAISKEYCTILYPNRRKLFEAFIYPPNCNSLHKLQFEAQKK